MPLGRYFTDGRPLAEGRGALTRNSPTLLNVGRRRWLFWDGRAPNQAVDPQTGETFILNHGALESQVFGPPVSNIEMAHNDRDWDAVSEKIATVRPLAMATDLPPDTLQAIQQYSDYPSLFEAAFGDTEVTAARIAMAIATYERTLIPNQTPWDFFIAGDQNAMTNQEISGWNVFQNPNNSRCAECHTPPHFTDNSFHVTRCSSLSLFDEHV